MTATTDGAGQYPADDFWARYFAQRSARRQRLIASYIEWLYSGDKPISDALAAWRLAFKLAAFDCGGGWRDLTTEDRVALRLEALNIVETLPPDVKRHAATATT